jgi:hypothetical protein
MKTKDGEVMGRADSGRVKITQKGKTMSIYLRQRDADAGHTPLELREHLTKICGFEDAVDIRLLDFILSEPDVDEIDNELSRRGYPRSVPEFDDISDNINSVGASEFWVSKRASKRVLDNRRRFGGRKPKGRPNNLPGHDVPDTVQSFLDKFNMANTFKDQLGKPWTEANADNMLAHICRLENVDPWALLPKSQNHFDQLLKSRRKAPGTVTGMHWTTDRGVHDKSHLRKTSNWFPATIFQDSRRNIRIKVSTAIENTVGDDMLFAAELFVSDG